MMEYDYCPPDSPESNCLVIITEDSEADVNTTCTDDVKTSEMLPAISTMIPSTVTSNSTTSVNKWYMPPTTNEKSEVDSHWDVYLGTEQSSKSIKPSYSNNKYIIEALSSCDSSKKENQVTSEQSSSHSSVRCENGVVNCVDSNERPGYDDRSFLMDSILGVNRIGSFSLKPENHDISGKLIVNNKKDKKHYVRRPEKPPYTYVAMIALAIMHSKNKRLSLNAIREKLKTFFPFFNGEYTGWKNSVRHALTNSKCFYKVEVKDETDVTPSVNHVWKVEYSSLKPNTFKRNVTALNADKYKDTLQEQLGYPLLSSSASDLHLPPKPTSVHYSISNLNNTDEDDFLNARNESVSTPVSVISEQDLTARFVCTALPSDKAPAINRKRKMGEDGSSYLPAVVMGNIGGLQASEPQQYQQTCNIYDSYQNYCAPQYMIGQQWSPDYGFYGYQDNLPIAQQEVIPNWHSSSQGFGYEQYYRQWWLNQSLHYAGHFDNYMGFQQNDLPVNSPGGAALDLTKLK